ncbi:TNKS2 [Symbiodinium natans]|uniref:TNKS2 protein n=1 Tax=Symbiodinium natans TaxID=878477 RepID=A0A812MN55_9DINO|nr:TNKS2 [Symbiodinium natans]
MACRGGLPRTALDDCAASLREPKELLLNFPMYVVPLETVMKMTQVRPHQELLLDGLLETFDPGRGKAMFISHQWTSEQHPDPDGKQLKIFQEAMSNLMTGRTVAQPNVWTELVFKLEGGSAQQFNASQLTSTPIWVWYDYFCIPQYAVDTESRSVSANKFQDQRNAIASISAYIDKCHYFVALCPLMKHANLSTLSAQSWKQRGWCRAEAVVRDLSVNNGLTLIVESPRQVSLGAAYDMSKAPGDGEFTIADDRKVIGQLVKDMAQKQLHNSLRTGDVSRYRFLLHHQSVLLRNTDTVPVSGLLEDSPVGSVGTPKGPEEIVRDFLRQNGFEKVSDRDTSGWSPLLYAALGGKPEVVEALLLQGADPNDYIRKVQQLVMFVKGTPALSICTSQGHNEATRVLLRFRADPNKHDPQRSSPLFYASTSDNIDGARILLEAGADPLLRSIFGTNAFDHACTMGATKILKEVLNVPPHALSQRDAIGFATGFGHASPETISVLLDMGCDKDGAVVPRNTLMKLFVSACALKHRVAPTSLTTLVYHQPSATPLMRSILSGSYSCALLLLETSARVDVRNSKNQTAFDLAVKKQAPDSLLWALWERGAGDYASMESIAWWRSNRLPVTDSIEEMRDSTLKDVESLDDALISVSV